MAGYDGYSPGLADVWVPHGDAYMWVDWETWLGDWETQKQVCLYAERLPSFLLLR